MRLAFLISGRSSISRRSARLRICVKKNYEEYFLLHRLCVFLKLEKLCVNLYGSVLLLSREELSSIRKNPYDSRVHLTNQFSINTTEIQCRMKLYKCYFDLIGVHADFMLERSREQALKFEQRPKPCGIAMKIRFSVSLPYCRQAFEL